MRIKRFIIYLAIIIAALAGCGREEPKPSLKVNAKSAVITEVANGRVLFEKNPDKRLQPASTVKIMTAVVAMEEKPLEEEIEVTETVLSVEPTNAGLEPGVKYRLKDLIAAILIQSANDAAVAIAEGVSGNEEEFAGLMNRKARKLGMDNTNFTSASGLPAENREDQYTTASDLAKMMRYALRKKIILEMMSQTEWDIYGSDNRRIHLKTHNKSLFSRNGMSWGKTGYTIKAGRTFAGVDPSYRPRIILTLLKSGDLWKDISVLKNQGMDLYDNRKRSLLGRISQWLSRR